MCPTSSSSSAATDTRTIRLGNAEIAYRVRESRRARRMSLAVLYDGRCEVVIPVGTQAAHAHAHRLLEAHADWVIRQVVKARRNADKMPLLHRGRAVAAVTRDTAVLVERTIAAYLARHPFRFRRVKVRSYRSRWGSCNTDRDLSFHYKLSLLPEPLAEYVVVHELCHTVHFDHSKDFWRFVESFCPLYRECRKELRKHLL